MSAIPIFKVPQVANITVQGINARMHMIIASTYGRSTFRLFRRAQNDFDFLLRDIDRQPVVLEGDLSLLINDNLNNLVMERPLVVVNEARGHYRCTFTLEDTLDIQPGLYSWCVKHIDTEDIERIMYTNQDYTVRGIMEVQDGFLTPLEHPETITTFTPDNGGFITSTFLGAAKVHNNSGNHSILLHLDDYTGTIFIDASLDDATPSDNAEWVPVQNIVYTDQTGIINVNFFGNYTFVRFRMTSATGLEKIVYRN